MTEPSIDNQSPPISSLLNAHPIIPESTSDNSSVELDSVSDLPVVSLLESNYNRRMITPRRTVHGLINARNLTESDDLDNPR